MPWSSSSIVAAPAISRRRGPGRGPGSAAARKRRWPPARWPARSRPSHDPTRSVAAADQEIDLEGQREPSGERIIVSASTNSFQQLMKTKIAVTAIAGMASGRKTDQLVNAGAVDKAASSSSAGWCEVGLQHPDGEGEVERRIGEHQRVRLVTRPSAAISRKMPSTSTIGESIWVTSRKCGRAAGPRSCRERVGRGNADDHGERVAARSQRGCSAAPGRSSSSATSRKVRPAERGEEPARRKRKNLVPRPHRGRGA